MCIRDRFHSIKENDEWWGEGFTEWVTVKKAKKLYENHVKPITPLDNNYYCLFDKNTVEWQTSLMKKYCIDGLIYYHNLCNNMGHHHIYPCLLYTSRCV